MVLVAGLRSVHHTSATLRNATLHDYGSAAIRARVQVKGDNTVQYNFIAKRQMQQEYVVVPSALTHTLTPVIKEMN